MSVKEDQLEDRRRWIENITEWMGVTGINEAMRITEDMTTAQCSAHC